MKSLQDIKGEVRAEAKEKRLLNRFLLWAILLESNTVTGFGSLLPEADKEVEKFKDFENEMLAFIEAAIDRAVSEARSATEVEGIIEEPNDEIYGQWDLGFSAALAQISSKWQSFMGKGEAQRERLQDDKMGV